ncbi:MAG: hypothetical protein ABFE07_28290 [Armatimonadia bacterium]
MSGFAFALGGLIVIWIGVMITWLLRRRRTCTWCAGRGRIFNSYDWRDCEVCQGRGWLPRERWWRKY